MMYYNTLIPVLHSETAGEKENERRFLPWMAVLQKRAATNESESAP